MAPRLVALLSFWHEDPQHLVRCVLAAASLADAIVAVDGRYAHFPGSEVRSSRESHAAIAFAAERAGVELLLHTPSTTFVNESEKRTLLFRLAEALTTPDDWLIVTDADTLISTAEGVTKADLLRALSECGRDVAEVLHVDHTPDGPHPQALRLAFRAQRGITVGKAHFHYLCPDGRTLWGHAGEQVPAFNATGLLRADHLNAQRDPGRAAAAREYYTERDRLGLEREACRCGNPGTHSVPEGWRLNDARQLEAHFKDSCAACLPGERKRTFDAVRRLGFDPARLQVRPSPTQPPVSLTKFFPIRP